MKQAWTLRIQHDQKSRGIEMSDYEKQGTGYDSGATGYELQGRQSSPESIVEQLRECAGDNTGTVHYCQAPRDLLLRAANKIVACEVVESYRRRWSSYTIDGTGWAEAAFEPMSNKELFRWARREGGPIVDCQY